MTANAVNLLAAGSALSNIFTKIKLKYSLWIVAIVATIVTFIPMIVGSFLDTFTAFLDYVGMVLGPIIAIICTDFYLRCHKKYDVTQLAKKNGSYWYSHGINWSAVATWVIGTVLFLILHNVAALKNTIGATFLVMLISGAIYYVLMLMFNRKVA